MTCSGKRSGLIAFNQRTTGLSGWRGAESFEALFINDLEKLKLHTAVLKDATCNTHLFNGGQTALEAESVKID